MEYEANLTVKFLRTNINVLKQFVQKKHDVEEKFAAYENIFRHLGEQIPHEGDRLSDLLDDFAKLALQLRELIENSKLIDLSIIGEDKKILEKLDKKIEHVSWRAVIKQNNNIIRVKEKELKKLHSILISMMKVIKRSKLIPLDRFDKPKQEFKKLEEYYFVQIYKFIRAYERIFRHLWRKERIIAKESLNNY